VGGVDCAQRHQAVASVRGFDLSALSLFCGYAESVLCRYLRSKQEDLSSLKPHLETYDAVVVANGHHSVPRYPSYPGQDTFKGHIMHSHAYKDPLTPFDFRRKHVVVVGIGNSGVDIANELSHGVTDRLWLSTRSGARILPKFVRGLAMDHVFTPPRYSALQLCPFTLCCDTWH
jgi:hypothetical protein